VGDHLVQFSNVQDDQPKGKTAMTRPRIRDGLDEFFHWMKETGRCSPPTATNYTSYARRVVRAVGKNPHQDVINSFFYDRYLAGTSYNNLLSAWKVYCEWRLDVADETIAVPARITKETRQRSDAVTPLPVAVRGAIRGLKESSLTAHNVFSLTWAAVSLNGLKQPYTHIAVPGEKNTSWRCQSEDVQVLWDHAQVGGDLWKPLVPREPGSGQPYPYRALLRELNTFTPEEVEAATVVKPPEPVTREERVQSAEEKYKSSYLPQAAKGQSFMDELFVSGSIGQLDEEA
jgi:hypothetical protein